MIQIIVLLENSTSLKELKNKPGLSLLIKNGISTLLLDVGPNNFFAKNAKKLNINLKEVDAVILSHSHIDHTGGLDFFCKINKTAPLYLFDSPDSRYYTKVISQLFASVSLKCNENTRKRIIQLKENTRIDTKTLFIHNIHGNHKKPEFNNALYMKKNGTLIPDTFAHEGVLVIEDAGELVLLNSCSHNGVTNSIETVKSIMPDKRIRSYVGGFHFSNPLTGKHERDDSLDIFCDSIKKENIMVYTGHCTGKYCVEYLQKRLGTLMHTLHTGDSFEV